MVPLGHSGQSLRDFDPLYHSDFLNGRSVCRNALNETFQRLINCFLDLKNQKELFCSWDKVNGGPLGVAKVRSPPGCPPVVY